ncbi:MAG: DNA gyrase inhibitor YacG [Acidobacteria bacterium]|nr:DNA gyrase inhibitor YacG [Acidobacteriota bacterium]
MSKPLPPELRQPKCARCRKQPVNAVYRPFCSKRCADADLGSWLNGSYTIAGGPVADADDAPPGASGVPDEDH